MMNICVMYHPECSAERETTGLSDSAQPLSFDGVDDRLLMELMEQQPALAIAALYSRYGRFVFSTALRIVGDRGSAEEITQDVFLGCWRNAAGYRSQRGSVATWLLSITRNRAIDELRSRRYKNRQRELALDAAGLSPGEDQTADLTIVRTQVRSALAALPTSQREVVELMYFGGLSRSEIAEQLRTPLGTIHTRLRLAMQKLRALLLPAYADEPEAAGQADQSDKL